MAEHFGPGLINRPTGSRASHDFGPTLKTLSSRELSRLRLLLEERPDLQDEPEAGGEWPRMVYHKSYLGWQQKWKEELNELEKPKHALMMVRATKKVFSEDEELEYIADGWKRSPADFLDPDKDPRIPRGQEARRAARDKKISVQQEISDLRRRLAELTGQVPDLEQAAKPPRRKPEPPPMADEPETPIAAAATEKPKKAKGATRKVVTPRPAPSDEARA